MSTNPNTRSFSCPLCRQDALAAKGGRQRWVRPPNLRAILSEIRAGRQTVPQLRSSIAQMCSDCQVLMLGISSDLDQRELETRIERSIRELEELAKERAA